MHRTISLSIPGAIYRTLPLFFYLRPSAFICGFPPKAVENIKFFIPNLLPIYYEKPII